MLSDSRIAKTFFEISIVLTLASMVLGPYDITDWSIACAATAGFLAVAGMYFAFLSWDEADNEPEVQEYSAPQETSHSETQGHVNSDTTIIN